MPPNSYSPEWFLRFLHGIDPAQTARELTFIEQHVEPGSTLLDLPCGSGRHARELAAHGHRVIAADREPEVLGPADDGLALSWICADMRALPLRPGCVDAVLCLWQSFGYFEAVENADVLSWWRKLVRPGGAVILDLYHREFFEANQGERIVEHRDGPVREVRTMKADRLVVDLSYPDGLGDRFEWQLFTPDEMESFANSCGWQLRLACSGFDSRCAPDPEIPRVQYVLGRAPGG